MRDKFDKFVEWFGYFIMLFCGFMMGAHLITLIPNPERQGSYGVILMFFILFLINAKTASSNRDKE